MEEGHDVRVAKNAGVTIVQGFFVNVANVLLFFIAARLLPTVADLGVYSTLVMIATLLYVVLGFALPRANVRFIARYIGLGRRGDAAGVARKVLTVGLFASTAAALFIWLLADPLSLVLLGTTTYGWLFTILAPYVFLVTFQQFIQSALGGLQRFETIAKIQIVQSSVVLGLGAFLLFQNYGLVGIIAGWTAGYLVGDLSNIVAFVRAFRGVDGSHPLRPLISFSMPLYGMDILSYLVQNVDKFLILLLAGTTLLGFYSPAVAIASFVAIIGTSLNAVLLPKLSEIHGQAGMHSLSAATKKASRWVFVICTPMSIGLAAIGYPLMAALGDRYLPSVIPLVVISLAMAVTSGQAVVNGALLSIGRTRVFLGAAIVGLTVNILLSILLLPCLGSTGVAVARAGLQCSLFLIPLAFATLRTEIDIDYRAMGTTLLSSTVMAIPVLIIQVFWTSVLLLPLYMVVGALTYLIMLKVTKTLKNEDAVFLTKLLPSQLSWMSTVTNWLVSRKAGREQPMVDEKIED